MSNNHDPGPPLNTFIVRFWPEPRVSKPRWRGQVQHIQSGERAAFAGEDALLRFIRRWVQTPESEVPQREEEQ